MTLTDKKFKMIKHFNKIVALRQQAGDIENKFVKLFEEIYKVDFGTRVFDFDGLVDSLQMGISSMTLEKFEDTIELGLERGINRLKENEN